MDGLRILSGPIISFPALFSVLTGIITVVLGCVFTRFSTGSRFNRETIQREPKNINILPYWTPWLGHTLSLALGGQAFLDKCSKRYKQAAFAVILRGKKYVVMTAPNLIQQLEDSHAMEPSTDARLYKLRYFFGDRSRGSRLDQTLASFDSDRELLGAANGILYTTEHVKKIARAVERTAYNLISFNESWLDQSSWERLSETVVDSKLDSSAEVSFFPLIETFVGELTTTALLGRNFLENNPEFLEDVRLWNSKGISFMNQIPLFLPQMSAAAAARQRGLRSLRSLRSAMSTLAEGNDPGTDWGDLSDVSPIMMDRIERWKTKSTSSAQPDVSTDAAVLWAFSKPNMLIAWLLYRVYSDASLLVEIRKEIEPFVQVEQMKSELPILESPRVIVHVEGLVNKSILLRAIMNETLLVDADTTSYGIAKRDIIVEESQEDAISLGKDMHDSYLVRKGEVVCIRHRQQQMVQRHGQEPPPFNPSGFSSLTNLKPPPDGGIHNAQASHVFGVQGVTCPGRSLAEQEIMVMAAVILSIWEMDGAWTWPGQKPGLCSKLPIKDIRVKISRRKPVA